MIYIILAWFLWFLFCFNLGFFVLRKLFGKKQRKIDFFYNFWFGLFLLIVVLQFISLFYPINDRVLICLSAINLLLLVLNLRNAKPNPRLLIKKLLQRTNILKVLLFAFIALLISLLSNLPVNWYDSLLYHLNSVKWLADYGTVRGLANIHFPLAYNNSTFILAAIMDSGPFTNSSSHIMNSFLLIVFSFQILLFLFKKRKNNLAYIFGLFSLLILSTFAYQINSLSTDLSLAVFFLLFNFYVITFENKDLALPIPILILAAASKFSSFVVLGLFSIFVLIQLKDKILEKKNIYILLFSVLFFVGFIARNLIMSGWAFYPLKLFGFHFPWQVPSEQIRVINDGLKAWSRLPGERYMSSLNVDFQGWFVPWFANNKANPLMLYSFLVIPLVFIYFISRNRIKKRLITFGGISKIDFLVFANVATLVYSFITAPDFRYMGTYILVAVSLVLSAIFMGVVKLKPVNYLIVLIFIYLISSNWSEKINYGGKKINVQKEESSLVQSVNVKYKDQSFDVLVPMEDDRCGNSELPCVPYPSGFKMFETGNIKAGFYPTKNLSE